MSTDETSRDEQKIRDREDAIHKVATVTAPILTTRFTRAIFVWSLIRGLFRRQRTFTHVASVNQD